MAFKFSLFSMEFSRDDVEVIEYRDNAGTQSERQQEVEPAVEDKVIGFQPNPQEKDK